MSDKIVRRAGETPNTYVEVHLSHDGDVYIAIQGQSSDGHIERGQIEFCTPNGGGYHPRTIAAFHNLAKAMEEDNNDPQSPERYKVFLKEV